MFATGRDQYRKPRPNKMRCCRAQAKWIQSTAVYNRDILYQLKQAKPGFKSEEEKNFRNYQFMKQIQGLIKIF